MHKQTKKTGKHDFISFSQLVRQELFFIMPVLQIMRSRIGEGNLFKTIEEKCQS